MGNIFSSGLNETIKFINHFLAATRPGQQRQRAQGSGGTGGEEGRALGWVCTGLWVPAPSSLLGEPRTSQSSHTGNSLSPCLAVPGTAGTHQDTHRGKSHWHPDCRGMVGLRAMAGPFLAHSFGLNIILVPEIQISPFSGFLKLPSDPGTFPTSHFEANLDLPYLIFFYKNHGTVWVGRFPLPQDQDAASPVGVTSLGTPKAEHELSSAVPVFLSFPMDFHHWTQLLWAPRQALNSFFITPDNSEWENKNQDGNSLSSILTTWKFISYLHFSLFITKAHQEPPNPDVSQHCCTCSISTAAPAPWVDLPQDVQTDPISQLWKIRSSASKQNK